MKGYDKIIREMPKLRVRRSLDDSDVRASLRQAIHDWIREDVGVAAKMTITPQIIDKLIVRLTVESAE